MSPVTVNTSDLRPGDLVYNKSWGWFEAGAGGTGNTTLRLRLVIAITDTCDYCVFYNVLGTNSIYDMTYPAHWKWNLL